MRRDDLVRIPRSFCCRKLANQSRLDVVCDHRAADRLQQDERQPAALDLLVLRHQRHQRVGIRQPFLRKARDVLQMGRQADGSKVALDAGGVGIGDHAELRGKLRRQHHADGNAFAMEQAIGEAGCSLQRMAESMTEIEQRALAGLALVARDDRGLGAAGGCDGMLARSAAGEDVGMVGFEPGEEGFIAQHAVFGDFGVAGAELARRQRIEHGGIGDHQDRLMKRAEQVLARGELMPVLPPTEESTCAKSEVGTCTKSTPRRRIAAAKPARSPTTPPPSAITRSLRSIFAAIRASPTFSRPA